MAGLILPRGFKKPAKFDLNPAHPLCRGMVGCWPLGDGTAASQSLSLYSPPAFANGTITQAANDRGGFASALNGSSSYFEVAYWAAQFNVFSGNRGATYHTRLNWTASTAAYNSLLSQDDANTGVGLALLLKSNQQVAFYISGGGGAHQDGVGGTVSFGVWHSVTAVFDGANIVTYIDGLPNATTVTGTLTYAASSRNLLIGAYKTSYPGAPSRYFNGAMDVPRIFSRALSPTEVAWLHAEPYAGIVPTQSDTVWRAAAAPPTVTGYPRTILL